MVQRINEAVQEADTGTVRAESVDPFEAALERTWRLLNPPVFHAHYCSKCFHLRVCYQKPCKYRATDLEREWECGCQHG